MKTPQEWMNQFTGLHEPILVTVNQMAIRDVQLDAFKAGAEWAAQFCEDQTYAAGGKRNLNEITYDTACIDCQKLILSETSNLKEIPK